MNKTISITENAHSTACVDASPADLIKFIRDGKWRTEIAELRTAYNLALKDGEPKKAVAGLKKELPGVLWSGRFSYRDSDHQVEHSGLLCADLDELGPRLEEVRALLLTSPHVWSIFVSPTGTGLKAVFCVDADAEKHAGSFRAIQHHVRGLCGVELDTSCKDKARLCFVSYDPDAYLNLDAIVIPPLPEPPRVIVISRSALPSASVNMTARQRIAVELLGAIDWETETTGLITCPGQHLHTTGNGERDCEIRLDGAPTIHCFHDHCNGLLAGVNHELRSRIGKAEFPHGGEPTSEEAQADEAPARPSAATLLVKLAEQFEFFHDTQNRAFAHIDVNGHREIWPVGSTQFKSLLAQIFYRRTKTVANRNALADAVATLQGRAQFDGPEESIYLRVAPYGDGVLIDMCDDAWRALRVTAEGWEILERSPVAFVRTASMRPLPIPASKGSLDLLWPLLNVIPEQRPLVAGALLNAFNPHGPYFVVNYIGEQGTGKSCAARIHRQIVDPNETPLRSPPREDRDLLVQAGSNRCVALDNLSKLPAWMSDGLCRLATGGGHSARSLYTDLDEISISVKRPVVLNGIEDVAVRPDLAERSLQIELETIPDTQRRSERELWKKFEAARPAIFAAILDGLVCALRDLPSVRLDNLPRMADAALWATAGEPAFGWNRGTFMSAYDKNLADGAAASVEGHPIGLAVKRLLEGKSEWVGEPSQLLKDLNAITEDSEHRSDDWPKNARALSAALRRLAQAFRKSGIELTRPTRGKRRSIRLCKAGEFASAPSASGLDNDVNDANDAKKQPLHDKGQQITSSPAAIPANLKEEVLP